MPTNKADLFREQMSDRYPQRIELENGTARVRVRCQEVFEASQQARGVHFFVYYPVRAADNLDCWKSVHLIHAVYTLDETHYTLTLRNGAQASMHDDSPVYVDENDLYRMRGGR